MLLENTSLPGEGALILWPLSIFLLATFLSLFDSFTLTLHWRHWSEVIHRQKVHSFVESIVVKSTCNNDDQYKLKIQQSQSGSLPTYASFWPFLNPSPLYSNKFYNYGLPPSPLAAYVPCTQPLSTKNGHPVTFMISVRLRAFCRKENIWR